MGAFQHDRETDQTQSGSNASAEDGDLFAKYHAGAEKDASEIEGDQQGGVDTIQSDQTKIYNGFTRTARTQIQ